MIDLIRASAVPATLMQSAAKGALSIPPAEMLEVLVYLSHHKIFGEQARLTLAGWDQNLSLTAARDPVTPREVLEYLIAPGNVRPALIPALLENPSVSEDALEQLCHSAGRDVVDHILASPRVSASEKLARALSSNRNLSESQAAKIEGRLTGSTEQSLATHLLESEATVNENEEILPQMTIQESSGGQEPLDADLIAYLNEKADEIAAEGEKPFQPIGGFYEDFVPTEEEPLAQGAPKEPANTGVSAAATHKPVATKKPHTGLEVERGSALQKISKLDIKGRIQLAMKGNKEERSLLIRDGTKIVALAVLDSPKITDGEVEKFASQKNVLEAVLRAIPLKRRFMKNYNVVRNLVFNPRTPLDLSLGLMKNIMVHDLKNLSGNKEVSDTVRKLAIKMFKTKTDTSKKGVD
jgi:hypothetical protein